MRWRKLGETGLKLGRAEDHSVTFLLDRDPDGISAEAGAGDTSTHIGKMLQPQL